MGRHPTLCVTPGLPVRPAGETHLAKSALCYRPSDELHTSASQVTAVAITHRSRGPSVGFIGPANGS
jgi:hypothetical protein